MLSCILAHDNIVIPLPFRHMFGKYLKIWEFNFIKYFSTMQFPPISTIINFLYFFPKALDIWNIGCTGNDEMHAFVFFCFQTFTLGYNRKLYLPNPCSESINHHCSQKNMQVTWQNIPCHAMVYFAMSFKVCHVENNIPRIFHDIAWNIFENSLLFKWVGSHVHLLTYQWIAFNSLRQNLVKGLFKTHAFMFWHLLCYVYEWPNFPNIMARSCLQPKCLTNRYLATLNASQTPTLQINYLKI